MAQPGCDCALSVAFSKEDRGWRQGWSSSPPPSGWLPLVVQHWLFHLPGWGLAPDTRYPMAPCVFPREHLLALGATCKYLFVPLKK